MHVVFAIGQTLRMAFAMFWKLFWPFSLGFLFSTAVEVMVSRAQMAKLLPDASARSILRASVPGAVSSSRSYVTFAIARSVARKGADFAAAMAFQVAAIRVDVVDDMGSTNVDARPAATPTKLAHRCGFN